MIFIEAFLIRKYMKNVEVWKDVIDYEGIYQVSNFGRIKSLSRVVLIKNKYPYLSKEKMLKPGLDSYGYYIVSFVKNKIKKTRTVHQLVAEAFLNHIPCGMELVVNHKNFIRTDNRVENLEIVTNRENVNQKHLPSTSKYTGVYKSNCKWISSIRINGEFKYLGTFNSDLEASIYYENALVSIKNNTKIEVKEQLTSSAYIGVDWSKLHNKWRARISINKKPIHLGYFETELEAHNAYQNKLKN